MDGDEDDISAERRRAEAAQWFARLKSVPVSHGTLEDFFVWRRDKQNADAFSEAERFWSDAGKAGEQPSILRAVEAAVDRGRGRRRFSWGLRPIYLGVPALLILLLMAIAGPHLFGPRGQIYRTALGEQRSIALTDGSRLHLNTDTRVVVRYAGTARRLVLESGEAYFSVAHDTARPFTVEAGGVAITATGTQFNVSRLAGRVVVTLVEGHVVVRGPNGSTVRLQPGEQWRWPSDGAAISAVNAPNVTAWTQGRIVFDGQPLADAIAEVNRYGGRAVSLDSAELSGARISGSFQAGDIDSFVSAVTAFLPLRERVGSDGRIHLTVTDKPIAANSSATF